MFQQSIQSLEALANFLKIARKRRGWRQEDVADRLQISLDTIKRAEKGHKGVSIGNILQMLYLYQSLDRFSDVIDPDKDKVGIGLEQERLPQRVTGNTMDNDF